MNRRLSGIERMITAPSQEASLAFTTTARVHGRFNESELRSALAKVSRKHPLLSVRVVEDDNGEPWFVSEGVADCPLRVIEGGTDDWLHEIKYELAQPFQWETGPLVRFVWIRSESCSDLIGVFHHGIADGLSGAYVFRDILSFLSNPSAEVSPLPEQPPFDTFIPPEIEAEMARMDVPPLPPPDDSSSMAIAVPAGPPCFKLDAWSLDEKFTQALITRSRKENASVHAALSTAFLSAFAQRYGEKTGWERRIQSPINIRNRLPRPIGEDVGLFMNLIITGANCAPDRNFWNIARDIKAGLIRESDPKKMFRLFAMLKAMLAKTSDFNRIVNMMMTQIQIDYDLSLSNLGRLDFPTHYGNLELVSLYGPTFAALGEDRIVGVSTFADQMFFTFIAQENSSIAPAMTEIRTHAMAHLEKATGI